MKTILLIPIIICLVFIIGITWAIVGAFLRIFIPSKKVSGKENPVIIIPVEEVRK